MNATAAESAWRVGDVIDGTYEVRAEITSGGMGVVYRVYHRGWNLELAVKTPRPELVSSPQRVADFETEAETWVGLGLHPHVVACVYVRRMSGLPRVFAEWVDGGTTGLSTHHRADQRDRVAGDVGRCRHRGIRQPGENSASVDAGLGLRVRRRRRGPAKPKRVDR